MTKEKFIQKWSHSTGEGMMGDLLSVMATECEEIQGAIKLITAESLIKETRIKELEEERDEFALGFQCYILNHATVFDDELQLWVGESGNYTHEQLLSFYKQLK